jgi:two-component system OmpR family response regulator
MGSLTFIVAEDDRFMREWLELALETLGARVVQAVNGWELAAHLDGAGEAAEIDLVISDVRMPGPSGLEILRRARASGNQVPFLLITGFGAADVTAAAGSMGAAVLHKPFSRRDLIDRVSEVCGFTAGGGAPEACSR